LALAGLARLPLSIQGATAPTQPLDQSRFLAVVQAAVHLVLTAQPAFQAVPVVAAAAIDLRD